MKTVKYILNNDNKFYEDIKEYLLKNHVELKKLVLKEYIFLPKFLKRKLISNSLKKINDLTISSKPIENLNIYIHKGKIDNLSIKAIKSAKKVLVNSYTQKTQMENKIKTNNIDVIYPYVQIEKKDKKSLKEQIFKDINISNPDENIILFNGKNFKSNGIKEFMNILSSIAEKNFVAFIVGDEQEINKNRFLIESYQSLKQHIYLIDINKKSYTLDDIYAISDIYILPTYRTVFSQNILKAMAYKNVVLIPSSNGAAEIVDSFSIMESQNDTMVSFKIDALLRRKKDLRLIQKTNKKIAKEYKKKRYLQSLVDLINSI